MLGDVNICTTRKNALLSQNFAAMPLYENTFLTEKGSFMHSILIQAITTQRVLKLLYGNYSRIVEPHAFGRNKTGNDILRCYQTDGGSVSGENVGWKLPKISEILTLNISEERFIVRHDYKRNDKAMTHIFRQIE